jgi:hypothetical protein
MGEDSKNIQILLSSNSAPISTKKSCPETGTGFFFFKNKISFYKPKPLRNPSGRAFLLRVR